MHDAHSVLRFRVLAVCDSCSQVFGGSLLLNEANQSMIPPDSLEDYDLVLPLCGIHTRFLPITMETFKIYVGVAQEDNFVGTLVCTDLGDSVRYDVRLTLSRLKELSQKKFVY